MRPDPHIIQRQVVELSSSARGAVERAQAAVAERWDLEIQPVLERVLDSLDRQAEPVVIDRLLLDLDRLPEDDFIEMFLARLEERLSERLQEETVAASSAPVEIPERKGAAWWPSRLGRVLHFLAEGTLPWWSPQTPVAELAEDLAELLRDHPAPVRELILRSGPDPGIARRIGEQLGLALLERATRLLSASLAEAVTMAQDRFPADSSASVLLLFERAWEAARGKVAELEPGLSSGPATAPTWLAILVGELQDPTASAAGAHGTASDAGPPSRGEEAPGWGDSRPGESGERAGGVGVADESGMRPSSDTRPAAVPGREPAPESSAPTGLPTVPPVLSRRGEESGPPSGTPAPRHPTPGHSTPRAAAQAAAPPLGDLPLATKPRSPNGEATVEVPPDAAVTRATSVPSAAPLRDAIDSEAPGIPSRPDGERSNRATGSPLQPVDPASISTPPADSAETQPAHPPGARSAPPPTTPHPVAAIPIWTPRDERPSLGVAVDNAGLVLLWPFLPRFLEAVGYRLANAWTYPGAPVRAVHLLQYLATGERQAEEPLLALNKILCGLALREPMPRDVVLNDDECREAEDLLQAAVGHWSVLGGTSNDGFRRAFLKRSGWLEAQEQEWLLRVERQAYDILLEQLPWGLAMVQLSWMPQTLGVRW